MPIAFEKTRHILSRRSRLAGIAWAAALALAGLWTSWAFFIDVPLYENSVAAQLQTRAPTLALEAEREGRIVESNLHLGREVEKGELLLALDTSAVELDLAKVQVELDGYRKTIEAIEVEIATLESAIDLLKRHGTAAAKEVASRLRQATAARELAMTESERARQLSESGALSVSEAERAQAERAKRTEEVTTVQALLERTRAGSDFEASQISVSIATLRRERVLVENSMQSAEARASTLELEIERHKVRAPLSGTVASVSEVRVGSILSAGEPLGSIVPDGELLLVAEFGPQALGRIEPEQLARVRFESLPWLQHGAARARVLHVAQELVDGNLRVELGLDQPQLGGMTLRHGMTAIVDIVVDEMTPIQLALRAIGVSRTKR